MARARALERTHFEESPNVHLELYEHWIESTQKQAHPTGQPAGEGETDRFFHRNDPAEDLSRIHDTVHLRAGISFYKYRSRRSGHDTVGDETVTLYSTQNDFPNLRILLEWGNAQKTPGRKQGLHAPAGDSESDGTATLQQGGC